MALALAGPYADHSHLTLSRQITTSDQVLFLLPSQQSQTFEDDNMLIYWFVNTSFKPLQIVTLYPQPSVMCEPKTTVSCKIVHVKVSLCTTVVHNTAQNSSDSLRS